jgi:hypothetical protein
MHSTLIVLAVEWKKISSQDEDYSKTYFLDSPRKEPNFSAVLLLATEDAVFDNTFLRLTKLTSWMSLPLATSDKDFLPAVRRLTEYGKFVRLYYRGAVAKVLAQHVDSFRIDGFSGIVNLDPLLAKNGNQ